LGIVNVVDLRPGMVLASNLESRQGRLLLPEGSVLEERHLRILRIWGITEADVDGVDSEAAGAATLMDIDPGIFRRCDAFLSPFFQNAGLEQEAVQEMFRICLLQTSQAMADSGLAPRCKRGAIPSPAAAGPLPTARKRRGPEVLLENDPPLATFPDIYQRVCEVINAPHSTSRHVANVVGSDPSLTARLLRLVNSPLYGFPARVESIDRAVALLGANELCTLVLGISALEAFKDVPKDLYDMELFWNHAVSCAVCARILAAYKPGLSIERAFVSGLLHDIGLLPMLMLMPEEESAILHYARAMSLPLCMVERSVLGFDHGQVGALLLERWNFPQSMVHIAGNHCRPNKAVPALEPSLIHVAELLAGCHGLCNGNCLPLPPLQAKAWSTLDISPSVIAAILNQASRQIAELRQIFFSSP
jgi:HD-like signal output (HDOD) protein